MASEQHLDAIGTAVSALNASLVEGNMQTRQVIVAFDQTTTTLDQIKAAIEQAGFAVAAAWFAPATDHHGDGHEEHDESSAWIAPQDLAFSVRLLSDRVTAEVGYDCPCGCTPQARFQKDTTEAGHEHCCCGRAHFVGADGTAAQLENYLAERRAEGEDADRVYELSERQVEAPWGGVLTIAFADPTRPR